MLKFIDIVGIHPLFLQAVLRVFVSVNGSRCVVAIDMILQSKIQHPRFV